jgi:phosphomannomutase
MMKTMKKNFINIYAKFLSGFLRVRAPLKAVFDCSNGPASLIVRKIRAKGLKISIINGQIDGRFPAHGPNPLILGAMDDIKKAVIKERADLGVIFDADADRAFFIDDKGRPVYPDEAVRLLTQEFPRQPIAIDVRIGYLIRKSKIKFFESKVGHFFFKNLMRRKKINFGSEISGHYYFSWRFGKKLAYYDSGIRGAIEMINQVSALKKSNRTLSEFLNGLPKYYRSGEINIKTRNQNLVLKNIENFYKKSAKRIFYLDGLSADFELPEKEWRFNIRSSNTEPYLRLNIEASTKKLLEEKQKQIGKLINNVK